MILIAIALLFEGHGWMLVGKGFLGNPQWLQIFILQLAIIGLLAVAVTLVIFTTGPGSHLVVNAGIDVDEDLGDLFFLGCRLTAVARHNAILASGWNDGVCESDILHQNLSGAIICSCP